MHLSKVARCVLTDTTALLLTVLIGLVITVSSHVPAAITLIQVLAVLLLAQALLLSVLNQEKRSHQPKQFADHQAVVEIVLFGTLAAVIAYLSYRLFFVLHGVGPAYIDTSHPLYVQATTLAFLTLVLCQFMNLLFVRSDERKHFFTDYLLRNTKLVRAVGISLFIVLNIIYNPWLQALFSTESLNFIGWVMALLGAALYTGLRLLQRHTRHHSRHAVIKLHREVHKTH